MSVVPLCTAFLRELSLDLRYEPRHKTLFVLSKSSVPAKNVPAKRKRVDLFSLVSEGSPNHTFFDAIH